MNCVDRSGERFGKLVVVRRTTSTNNNVRWECRCDCGRIVPVFGCNLVTGASTSCGCYRTAVTIARNTTHGKSKTTEWRIWGGMIDRCRRSRSKSFADYGKRGIRVCSRWRSFENFLADMGPRPSNAHSIERKDNDGPYSLKNCAWATRGAQARNTRRTHFLTLRDETLCITDWAARTGISFCCIVSRLNRGWSVAKTLTMPARTWTHRHARPADAADPSSTPNTGASQRISR